MTYDCLMAGDLFVVAKRKGHVWSAEELAQFSVLETEAVQATEDYQIELSPSVFVWASEIDPGLVAPEEPF